MIIYEGPSLLDGKPIVVVTSHKSSNAKTGPMTQTWILRQDIKPSEAQHSGEDKSVCGDCPSRPINKKKKTGPGDCYVNMMAPTAVWKAYQRGSYKKTQSMQDITKIGAGRAVRLGSYGDPAAVPKAIWEALLLQATSHTGYTHQWRQKASQELLDICMASADTEMDHIDAIKMGWRTFRVIRPGESVPQKTEFRCPSDPLLVNKHIPCIKCKACSGVVGKEKMKSPYIVVHGFRSKKTQKKVADTYNL